MKSMKRFIGLIALAVIFSFGIGTVTFAGNPEPAPTEEKGKDQEKKPGSPKAEPDSKDEKKDDKGGK